MLTRTRFTTISSNSMARGTGGSARRDTGFQSEGLRIYGRLGWEFLKPPPWAAFLPSNLNGSLGNVGFPYSSKKAIDRITSRSPHPTSRMLSREIAVSMGRRNASFLTPGLAGETQAAAQLRCPVISGSPRSRNLSKSFRRPAVKAALATLMLLVYPIDTSGNGVARGALSCCDNGEHESQPDLPLP